MSASGKGAPDASASGAHRSADARKARKFASEKIQRLLRSGHSTLPHSRSIHFLLQVKRTKISGRDFPFFTMAYLDSVTWVLRYVVSRLFPYVAWHNVDRHNCHTLKNGKALPYLAQHFPVGSRPGKLSGFSFNRVSPSTDLLGHAAGSCIP